MIVQQKFFRKQTGKQIYSIHILLIVTGCPIWDNHIRLTVPISTRTIAIFRSVINYPSLYQDNYGTMTAKVMPERKIKV
jgi:hypothetical protein